MSVTVFSGPVQSNGGFIGSDTSLPGATIAATAAILNGQTFGTIQSAINNALSGDTIFIQPGAYAENLVVTTDYLTLMGAQISGFGRPDVEPTSGVTLVVTAQGFTAKRMRFAGATSSDVVQQKGNGFVYVDCVFDGDGNSGSGALMRLIGHPTRRQQSASEGVVIGCLYRGSGAKGLVFDTAPAAGAGTGSTDNRFYGCRFYGNANADIESAKTFAGGTYSLTTTLFKDNDHQDLNKAVYVDFVTNAAGVLTANTATLEGCYFATDTATTVIFKTAGTKIAMVGCYNTVGIINASTFHA